MQLKTNYQYIYINNRPIKDYGIVKAVMEGYSTFIPSGMKVPFVLKIKIDPNVIDVNVHPRKEEIRFINAFRVYSAIEKCVNYALSNEIKSEINNQSNEFNNSYASKTSHNSLLFDKNTTSSANNYNRSNTLEMRFDKKPKDFNVMQSLNFSKNLLDIHSDFHTTGGQNFSKDYRKVIQIFNKYIIIEFNDHIWVVDQHAAAERVNFEKLQKNRTGSINEVQSLLLPIDLILSKSTVSLLKDNLELMSKIGFKLEVEDEKVKIFTTPAFIDVSYIESIFNNIDESTDIGKEIGSIFDGILATIACHGSIRSGQHLSESECIGLIEEFMQCDNPYSCPHGRPAIWKLNLNEIDKNFLRTY